jgi:hypothetical protein
MPQATFVPGSHTHPGWDINGDGKADIPAYIPPHIKQRGVNEVRQLNQYQGYFTTPEGDFPVTVVANSIKEAAKILTMPGVFGDEVSEPSLIKFLKGKVAVSVPVHHVGFNTRIDPQGAVESGAYATPVHAEVHNGTEVIFTAYEPFGWKFLGWFKGDLCLSTELVAYIDVYDPYSTLVEFVAKYEFDPQLRNGRYISLGVNSLVMDFKFDGWLQHAGRLIINGSDVADWHFIITTLEFDPATKSGKMVFITDPKIVSPQPETGGTFSFSLTPMGLQLEVDNISVENIWTLEQHQVISLKWEAPVEYTRSFHGGV